VDRRLFGLMDATSVSTSPRRVEPRCEESIESGTLLGPEGSARKSWYLGPHTPSNHQVHPARDIWQARDLYVGPIVF
jgi:hypothetical protein